MKIICCFENKYTNSYSFEIFPITMGGKVKVREMIRREMIRGSQRDGAEGPTPSVHFQSFFLHNLQYERCKITSYADKYEAEHTRQNRE